MFCLWQGISLPIDQFNTMIKLIPHIESILAEKGQSIERPDYGGASTVKQVSAGASEDDEEEAKGKRNFEATSEEDD